MSRKKSPMKANPKPAGNSWVQYLPAIIQAGTALLEVVLRHFHP